MNALHQNKVKTCPACESTAVEFGELPESPAKCRACGHVGLTSEFPSYLFFTEQKAELGLLLQRMADDMRQTLGAEVAALLYRFLFRWGFLFWGTEPPADERAKQFRVQVLGLYVINAAKALMRSVIATREQIEPLRLKEAERVRNSN